MNHFPNGRFTHYMSPAINNSMMGHYVHSPVNRNFAVYSGIPPYYLQVLPYPSYFQHQSPNTQQNDNLVSQAAVNLMRDNRSLWEEHVAWTRMTIISLIYNLPDIEFVVARLLKNAVDMGEMIRPLYGDAAAKRYSSLIQDHLLIAADLVKAAIAGDEQAAKTAEQKWYANADEISVFLNSVNPYLTVEEMKDMFHHHLDLTKQEAITMINKDFKKDIEIYDEIEKQAREMADTISNAMIKLYPNKFR